ncbi:MAG: S9 family peptidase [Pseudomonadales bacterium]|nr:S9 family peptidase [Pseudomonadales bacterium]
MAVSSLAEVPVASLVEPSSLLEVSISPAGEFVGVRAMQGHEAVLLFLDSQSLQPVGSMGLADEHDMGSFKWVSNRRAVGQIRREKGTRTSYVSGDIILFLIPLRSRPRAFNTGELFATDVDGSDVRRWSFDWRGDGEYAPVIEDGLPGDASHMLVSTRSYNVAGDLPRHLYEMDVHHGGWKSLGASSRYGAAKYYVDKQGRPRLITSIDEDGRIHVQAMAGAGNEWIEVPLSYIGPRFRPLAIAADGDHAWVLNDAEEDKLGVYRFSLKNFRSELVYVDDKIDVSDAFVCIDRTAVCAVRLDDGYPRYIIFADAGKDAVDFDALVHRMTAAVTVTNWSEDGRYWTVRRDSDRDPGSFYLFDREQGSLHQIADSSRIAVKHLARTEPVSFVSDDGMSLSGYLTRATDPESKGLVVLVHDGPDVRDYWSFNPTVQALATHGFSVLQVNFRGSHGYGKRFMRASEHEWGRRLVGDIIAGTRWAIEQGIAEPGRISIMGTGFGAYAALQSAVVAPRLYACVLARGGLYNLQDVYSRQFDFRGTYFGARYIADQLGIDANELDSYSPVKHLDDLAARVLLVHGRLDERVPRIEATRLARALKKHDKPYHLMMLNDEDSEFSAGSETRYLESAIDFFRSCSPGPVQVIEAGSPMMPVEP